MNESYGLKVLDGKLSIRKMLRWYQDKIYLSFSGVKVSTVLAHLIKSVIKEEIFCNILFVFSNTSLELPETIDFVNGFSYEDVHKIYPDMRPIEVFEKYGKQAISKKWDDRISAHQNKLRQGFTKEEAVNPLVSRHASMLVGNHHK